MSAENKKTPIGGIDWDAEMRTLLEESGIDPDRNRPMTKAQRRRRQMRASRGAILLLVVVLALGLILIGSGAPAAAVVPLLLWCSAWVAVKFWRSFGSPTLRDLGARAGGRGSRTVVLIVRLIGRSVWYPAQNRLRAARVRVARAKAAAEKD
ncbi:hypothetical protein ACTD5D_41150 [Nocardia takedensis]|uniref:hypothetical protein n=1 Tax=Nocardia takedensis TaxID=259390 RepID=UPI003F7635BF